MDHEHELDHQLAPHPRSIGIPRSGGFDAPAFEQAITDLLRACAAKGITAAFLTSAGYGEAGDDGRIAEAELVALADELGILLAGPNGQGVVSTPVNLCAQIVAPYPPAGRIGGALR